MSDQGFDPMKEISSLRDSLGRALEQGLQAVGGPSLSVRVDAYELDDSIIVRTSAFDGIDPTSIEVSVENDVLTISGRTQEEELPEGAEFFLQERRFGEFSRAVELPKAVKADEAQAKLKNGVLVVTIPLDTDGYRRIKITSVD